MQFRSDARKEMPTTSIAMLNRKGGTGKSSTCFHLSGYFASIGLKTLVVDADPQGSLSNGFFGSDFIENLPKEETLAAIFDPDRLSPPAESLVVPTAIPGLSIVRTNESLDEYNKTSPENFGMQQYVLSTFLEELEATSRFDIVLLDCPPNLYECSWNALVAADFVIIPVPPEDFGTQGLRVVHQAIQNARVLNKRLRRLGHLISRTDRNRILLHRNFENQLRQRYNELVFDAVFPESADYKTAISARTPISQLRSRSAAGSAIEAIGIEVLQRIERHAKRQRAA